MINTLKCTFFTKVSMVPCCNVIQCDVDARPILVFDSQMVKLMKYSSRIILFLWVYREKTLSSILTQGIVCNSQIERVCVRSDVTDLKVLEHCFFRTCWCDGTSVSVSLLFVRERERVPLEMYLAIFQTGYFLWVCMLSAVCLWT